MYLLTPAFRLGLDNKKFKRALALNQKSDMNYENSLEFAKSLDSEDRLKHFREYFHIPQHNGKDKIYFSGNSLGLAPKTAEEYVLQELQDWAILGGEGHFEARRPWFPYHEIFPQQLSKLIGCL